MKKGMVFAMSMILLMVFVSAIGIVPVKGQSSNGKWTFMVYIDADNNLDPAGVDDILEMQSVGSTADINVVVLFDRWFKTCGFNGTEILYIHKGYNETVWGDWTNECELNMGDPKTLTWFINYAVENYMAEKYALILWDHGDNWEGVCWDWTNEDYLTIEEVKEAITKSEIEKVDLLGFDACLMASIEVAYSISLTDKVGVMVASEDFVPWDGQPYDMILNDLKEYPKMDARSFAVTIVDKYIASYTHTACFATLSAIDLKYIKDVASAMATLTNKLLINIKHYKAAITSAKNLADRYWFGFWHQGPYIDLYQFIYGLGRIKNELRQYTGPILTLWDNLIIYSKCCNGPHIKSGAGLTIYFPRNKNLFYTPEPYYNSVPEFAETTRWYELLTQYFE